MLVRLRLKLVFHIYCITFQKDYNRNENGIVKKVMTVYCVQEPPGTEKGMPRINVNKALHFGNIEFLFSERAQLVYSSGALVRELRKKLEKFNDEDYLLLLGDPAIIATTSAVVADVNHGKFKMLKWDRESGRYYPLEVNLYQKENTYEQNRF